ncbi:MAG: hypothetical protein ABI729_01940 [Chitinophagales bacterium]
MKTSTSNHSTKTVETIERNQQMHFLQHAGIETGAWMMSLGFFAGVIWMAINII